MSTSNSYDKTGNLGQDSLREQLEKLDKIKSLFKESEIEKSSENSAKSWR